MRFQIFRPVAISATYSWKRCISGLSLKDVWNVYPPVARALREGRPVVALESTIVAHGMPYPQNVQLTQQVGKILRSKGVEPATIAIKDGECCIGLSPEDLDDLGESGPSVRKCSTRELSLSLCKTRSSEGAAKWGATTVASTMRLAHLAGIHVFVTGGIGGVHRDGENTMDISADLTELARTPVVVVCAGIKSILDIGRTLEVLETYVAIGLSFVANLRPSHGVPAISYKCDEFPAFFTASSGIHSPERMDSSKEIADAYCAAQSLGLPHGMLVAVPNVQDPAGANVEFAIQTSIKEAESAGISGQHVTPYILKRVNELTKGDSLRSNMALVVQNALVGAEIALELSQKQQLDDQNSVTMYDKKASNLEVTSRTQSDVIVVGAAIIDLIAKPKAPLVLETSNPATCRESDGGVGRNVAEALGRLGSRPVFYSAVGDDNAGRSMIDRLERECGVVEPSKTVSIIPDFNTARYLAILDDHGDLEVACADVSVVDQIHSLPDDQVLAEARYLVLDANLPTYLLQDLACRAAKVGTAVVFEPTSVPKAKQVEPVLRHVSFAFPNIAELQAILGSQYGAIPIEDQMKHLLNRMHPSSATLVVTAGKDGVFVGSRVGSTEPNIFTMAVKRVVSTENTTGAGDTFVGAFLHAMLRGRSLEGSVNFGMKAAELSVQYSKSAISPLLSPTNPVL